MNSYNDNLNSVVVSSLQAQELENKQLNSERIAAMFTLYHAEGATIYAYEKLEADQGALETKGKVLEQAVENTNLCTNLLASATQASAYVAQAVTNTSVAAANTQIAGNAVLKLAGDMGNVFSIVNAADFDTEIYAQGKEAMDLINETAYLSEVATQTAMNASIKTSEVSAATVLSKAKATSTQMQNLQQITTTDFNNTLQTVLSDTTNLSSTSVAEKAAEGQYEDIVAEYKAARGAYVAMNEQLNLGLVVRPSENASTAAGSTTYLTQRTIAFDLVTSPFAAHMSPNVPVANGVKLGPDANPVAEYYVLLVNEKNKSTFSITEAQAMIMKEPNNYLRFRVEPATLKENTTGTAQIYTPPSLVPVNNGAKVTMNGNRASFSIDFYDIGKDNKKLNDSDGNAADLGVSYVVFVMAVYDNNYKRRLNYFEDFLSATSNTFKMAYLLTEAYDVKASEITDGNKEYEEWYTMQTDEGRLKTQPDTHKITFSVCENPSFGDNVVYRCILLPQTHEEMHGLLTRATMHDLENEVNTMEQIAEKYDPIIVESYDRLMSMRISFERMSFVPFCQMTNPPTTSAEQKEFNAEYKALQDKVKGAEGDAKKTAKEELDILMGYFRQIGFIPTTTDPNALQTTVPPTSKEVQAGYNQEYSSVNDVYANAWKEKEKAEISIRSTTVDAFSFLFNLRLAEQVTAGNYLQPTRFNVRESVTGKPWPVHDYMAPFGPEATDNFGNTLIPDHDYSVVVLSVSEAPGATASRFLNNWTGNSEVVAEFTYTVPKVKKEGTDQPADQDPPVAKLRNAGKGVKKNKNRKK